MLGKLARQHESDSCLHLAGRQRLAVVALGKGVRLARDTSEYVGDERIHDFHACFGYAGIRVHLLQHLVDVALVRLGALSAGNLRVLNEVSPFVDGRGAGFLL